VPTSVSPLAKAVATVTCTANEAPANTTSCSFTVTIRDLQAPAVTCSTNITANTDAGQCSKSNVTYTATASDNCPGVTVACVPASGSTFAKGVTAVNCTDTDTCGNTDSCS